MPSVSPCKCGTGLHRIEQGIGRYKNIPKVATKKAGTDKSCHKKGTDAQRRPQKADNSKLLPTAVKQRYAQHAIKERTLWTTQTHTKAL